MSSAESEILDLRREAQWAASTAWDDYKVNWDAEPAAPRLAAAVDAAVDVYEQRLEEKGNFGYDVRVKGGPSVFDGTTRHLDRLDQYVVLIAKQHGTSTLAVYELNYQTQTLTYVGTVEEASPST